MPQSDKKDNSTPSAALHAPRSTLESVSIDDARSFYTEADSAHDFQHVLRVTAMADKLARAEGADVEVVRAAALLHDSARAEEDHASERVDHAELSARQAHAFLLSQGASDEFAERVADAIRAHRYRGSARPASLEAQILFDADKLDAIGAIGVARAFAVAGSLKQKLYSEPEPQAEATRDQHNSDHSPVAEFHVKLAKLRERFHTRTAREIAEQRHAFMAAFFERLGREVRGEA